MHSSDVQKLIAQFRLEVDDLQPEGVEDESDRLFKTPEILHYLDQAQKEFVRRTLYIHKTVEVYVPPEEKDVRIPEKIIKADRIRPYLREQKISLNVCNANELAPLKDDYGQFINAEPFRDLPPGRPRAASFDFDEGYVRLIPSSAVEDTLEFEAYVAAPMIRSLRDKLVIRNEEHQFMLLPGMKYRAYRKQDADSYDPNQARSFQGEFTDLINEVYGERQRRRRKPGTTCYGGL